MDGDDKLTKERENEKIKSLKRNKMKLFFFQETRRLKLLKRRK
jgi:hypothetical protein